MTSTFQPNCLHIFSSPASNLSQRPFAFVEKAALGSLGVKLRAVSLLFNHYCICIQAISFARWVFHVAGLLVPKNTCVASLNERLELPAEGG